MTISRQDKTVNRPRRRRSRGARRRQISCPLHECLLDSASQKHYLYLDQAGQLQVRGMGKHTALMVLAVHGQVALRNEWLECFWCPECQKRTWYHVIRQADGALDRVRIGLQNQGQSWCLSHALSLLSV